MIENIKIKWYSEIDSTNLIAERECANADEGSVWIADYQTSGRGQKGNSWESEAGKNLTFTLLLKPLFLSPINQSAISQVVSLGVVKYLKNKDIKAKIKWPNDIYVDNKKICGILIEHTITGDKLAVSIVGIGFNLNQEKFASDAPNPISLIQLNHDINEYDRGVELNLMLSCIDEYYTILFSDGVQKIRKIYVDNLFRLGIINTFYEIGPEAKVNIPIEKIKEAIPFRGKIIDVDEYGCIVIEHTNGVCKTYAFKEVKYLI